MKMNYKLIIWIGSFLLFWGCIGENERNTPQPDKRELEKSIERFNMAFAEGNLIVLDSLTTENYLHTNSNSRAIGKSDWFNYLKKRNKELESGTVQVLDYRLEETRIEHHTNCAILTGKVTVKVKDSSGIKTNNYRITNLWVIEDGTWKRAGFHDTKIN